MRLWLYVHFRQLLLDILGKSEANSEPCAVVEQGLVLECNQSAQKLGIEPNMALATVLCLAPDIQLLADDTAAKQRRLASLCEWAQNYSSKIQAYEPNGLLFEIASVLKLKGGLDALETEISQALLGYQVRYSTGFGYLSAKVLACSGLGGFLSQAELVRRLSLLSIKDLELPEKTEQRLARMGFHTLADVKKVPRKELGFRLGHELLSHLDKLYGVQKDEVAEFTPELEFFRRIEFQYEVCFAKGLLMPLRNLLQQLTAFQQTRQLYCLDIQLTFSYRQHDDQQHWLRLANAELDTGEYVALAKLLLEKIKLPEPVMALGLLVAQFFPFNATKQDMFVSNSVKGLPTLLNQLYARLGEQAVYRIAPVSDPRPHYAYRCYRPEQGEGASLDADVAAQPLCWLFAAPKAIDIARFRLLSKPERIAMGWWQHKLERLDYYLAEDASLDVHQVYRNEQGQWFSIGICYPEVNHAVR